MRHPRSSVATCNQLQVGSPRYVALICGRLPPPLCRFLDPLRVDRGARESESERAPMASPSSSPLSRRRQGGGMVEMELDAARALADLAVSATTGSESGGGSRSRKQSQSESPDRAHQRIFPGQEESSVLGDTCSAAGCSRGSTATYNRVEESAHTRQSSELIKSSIKVPADNSSSCGGRAKQNFTEAEKEIRRVRRILANRESARQTIRRRWALREELTRKVADLSLENENLKKEKNLAMKENLSLKDMNEQLKEQIAKTVRSEDERNVNTATTELESPTPSTTKPQLIAYGESPFIPFMCPPWPLISGETIAFFEQGNPNKLSGSVPPHYMPPCAWYYPFHHEVSGSAQCSHAFGNKEVERIGGKHGWMQSYKELDNVERECLHGSDAKENTSLATVGTEKENATKSGAIGASGSAHRDEQILKPSPERTIRMPSFITTVSTHDEKPESHDDRSVPEKVQGSNKLLGAASAAAEARKRRKELTKLKQSRGKQPGLQS